MHQSLRLSILNLYARYNAWGTIDIEEWRSTADHKSYQLVP